ncbi:DUF4431 domain-containing protein [Buttiauxella selenatireducens]|uniref:DUF4431 domain-containing protein n=1 Tax=Buttiauxella selenatireducens TaxID=3073902 RepID=A0ABY9SF79_9ENTR|nr:DUF4431 domain-containing protein [Buttiauxella sp. R73]WMY75608.1 DUF4431 domain-containing protein [Buttiauxella sp. R73]
MPGTIAFVFLSLITLFTSTVSAACLDYEKNVKLSGYLEVSVFFGAPGFGEDPKTDRREIKNILFLDEPVCANRSDNGDAEKEQIEVTLETDESPGAPNLDQYVGKHITVVGKLTHALTGHDHTSLILESVQLSDTDSEARARIERKPVLDAVRQVAVELAGQTVRIKVSRLNVSDDWAVLMGELVAPEGSTLDWSLAKDCNEDLDKMLWSVLNKSTGQWKIKEINICASEPPYWYLKDSELTMPCGVYKGLDSMTEGAQFADLAQRCEEVKASGVAKGDHVKINQVEAIPPFTDQQKRMMLIQFQHFQKAVKDKDVATIKSFIIFPAVWDVFYFWPEGKANPPGELTVELFDKYSKAIVEDMSLLSGIKLDPDKMTMTEFRVNALAPEEQSRKYISAGDVGNENIYYYLEKGDKHFVNGTCDDISNVEISDTGLIAYAGSGSNHQLPGLSELCEHQAIFDFEFIDGKLRLKDRTFAG